MKVAILAGGFGTRLSEYTDDIPKPMVEIGGLPILWHIMTRYASFGLKEFVIATGYKSQVIKNYFLKYRELNSDFTIDLSNSNVQFYDGPEKDWKVTVVNTGMTSMTGGRLLRLKPYLGDSTFLATYGDGVADINIEKLLAFHSTHKKPATVTAVQPDARFGALELNGSGVESFREKSKLDSAWVNGGFFVFEPSVLDLIEGDHTVLEQRPLMSLARDNQLMAYRHDGFWQCMDTKRDHDYLEKLWQEGTAPWV